MELDEIVLPETKPETEWIRGRALQKVSPVRDRGRLQTILAVRLHEWSAGRGEVATEWRFRVKLPGEARRPLVPDIAFVAYERMRGYSREQLQAPPFAPNLAVEILSPDDEAGDIADKVDTLLRPVARSFFSSTQSCARSALTMPRDSNRTKATPSSHTRRYPVSTSHWACFSPRLSTFRSEFEPQDRSSRRTVRAATMSACS